MEEKEVIQQAYAYWLNNIPGIGRVKARQLTVFAGTPETLFYMSENAVEPFLTEAQKKQFISRKQNWKVEAEYARLKSRGIQFFPYFHPSYPEKLRQIPDSPFGIYVKGKLPRENVCTIALIGARRCSEYGRFMARTFGYELGRAGIQIISGLASGVDGIAQKGALEAGGDVFGVMGCGVDICYPEENVAIYDRIVEQGGILSEYTPGTPPRGNLFPPRNRIISGLADAVLVIEAKQKSGTLITVDMALEQGKDVYALPGRVTDALSKGCNSLIEQGAGMVLSPERLLEELNVLQTDRKKIENTSNIPQQDNISKEEKRILKCLDDYPCSVEVICDKLAETELTVPFLMSSLLQLQLRGFVGQRGGSYYLQRKEQPFLQ